MTADEGSKSWDDLVGLLTKELQSAGAEDYGLRLALGLALALALG